MKSSKNVKVPEGFPEGFLWGGATAANQYEGLMEYSDIRIEMPNTIRHMRGLIFTIIIKKILQNSEKWDSRYIVQVLPGQESIRQVKRQSQMRKDWNFTIKYLKSAENMEWKLW